MTCISIFPNNAPEHLRALLYEATLRRAAYDRRKGERPPNPNSLGDIDVLLRSPDWEHLGKSSEGEQLYQGLTGPPGLESSVRVPECQFLTNFPVWICDRPSNIKDT